MIREPARFAVGDEVLFLGSERSCYGINGASDKYIGKIVTIKEIHPTGYPYAYTFTEFDKHFWFSESCFEYVLPELPEFEAAKSLDLLF